MRKTNLSQLAVFKKLLEKKPLHHESLDHFLRKIPAAKVASHLIHFKEDTVWNLIIRLCEQKKAGEVLEKLPKPHLTKVMNEMKKSTWEMVLKSSTEEEVANLLHVVDPDKIEDWLEKTSSSRKEKIKLFLNYPEDSAGRKMQSQVFTLSSHFTAQKGLEELRKKHKFNLFSTFIVPMKKINLWEWFHSENSQFLLPQKKSLK